MSMNGVAFLLATTLLRTAGAAEQLDPQPTNDPLLKSISVLQEEKSLL